MVRPGRGRHLSGRKAMMSESSERHREAATGQGPVTIAVVTVSDSRTPDDDVNGAYLRERIEAAGHRLTGYRVIRDEPEAVASALEEFAPAARLVLFNGGTGISRRDN